MTAPTQFRLYVPAKYHDMGAELLSLKFVPPIEQVGRIRDRIIDPPRYGRAAPAQLTTAV